LFFLDIANQLEIEREETQPIKLQNYKKTNFATKIVNKNQAPDEILLISPTNVLITT
tara:strand:- start:8 stop:178 length:171 start_codon:yes stop_codon:yes gene_type:complete